MIKIFIKHKLFDYALDTIFKRLQRNFIVFDTELKIGMTYKSITMRGRELDGTLETHYNATIVAMNINMLKIKYDKVISHQLPEHRFLNEVKVFGKCNNVEVDMNNKEITVFPLGSCRSIAIEQIVSIIP